jgi:hypothetical protein
MKRSTDPDLSQSSELSRWASRRDLLTMIFGTTAATGLFAWLPVRHAMGQEVGATRGAPAPLGTEVVSGNLGIFVLEVFDSDASLARLDEFDPLTPAPPPGQEYVLARLRVRHTGDGESITIKRNQLRLTASGNALYPPPPQVIPPDPSLEYTLDPAEEVEVWVALRVGQDETDRQLVYVFDAVEQFERWRYLALAIDAVLPVGPPEVPAPNDVGVARNQPAALGAVAVTPYFAVQVLEGVHGDEALKRLLAAEPTNPPPLEGNQHVLLKVRVTSRVAEEIPVYLSPAMFSILGKADSPYFSSFPYPVVPEPSLYGHLYPGGSAEGWMAFEIASNEDQPVLGHLWPEDPDGNVRFFAIP